MKTFEANGQSTKLTLRVESNTIFQINATYTPLEEATNNKTIEGGSANDVVLDAVGIGITLIDSSIDTADNARNSLGFLAKEIESVAQQLGTIGANLSELEIATERLSNQVYLSERACPGGRGCADRGIDPLRQGKHKKPSHHGPVVPSLFG